MPYEPTTNFKDSNNVDLGKKLVTKDYLLEVYGTILENSPASGLVVTPELWGWGRGNDGALGINALEARPTPVTTFSGGTNWKQVSAGYQYTAAIKTDGTLWTFGQGRNPFPTTPPTLTGNLGINEGTNNRATPVTTFAGGTDWKQVSTGSHHTAAIKTDGSLWIWGANNSGQLGINDGNVPRSTPVTTFTGGNTWKQVSCGSDYTAAIKTDGSLWTWGSITGNNSGGRSTPVTTFAGGTNWKSVDCGTRHTAAIKTDGTLWVWGNQFQGELGINVGGAGNQGRETPVTTFTGGNTWKSVASGYRYTTAIKTDGSLWVWGGNGAGQLGTNNTITRSTPVTTFAGGNNWKQVSCGGEHTAAIKTDGTLWTWGTNTSLGQLGINDTNTAPRSTPVTTFAGGNNWKQVDAGTSHTIAIQSNDYI
jgi:alpha-tubulin suppressor-like RCC1 family protein